MTRETKQHASHPLHHCFRSGCISDSAYTEGVRIQVLSFRVQELGLRVLGVKFWVLGLMFDIWVWGFGFW